MSEYSCVRHSTTRKTVEKWAMQARAEARALRELARRQRESSGIAWPGAEFERLYLADESETIANEFERFAGDLETRMINAPRAQRRVVIVDDNKHVAEAAAAAIARDHVVVGIAATARDAVRLVTERDPDVVISDQHLDGAMTGLELLERLRQHFPLLRVVLYTGDRAALEKATGIAHAIIAKPSDTSTLIARVLE